MADTNKRVVALVLAAAIAGPCEGLRQYAYRDVTGLPTICMGSTKGVKMTDFRTVPECRAMLTKEMIACNSAKSTAARKLAACDHRGACIELLKWDKARIAGVAVTLPGLTKRRVLERDLCLSGVA